MDEKKLRKITSEEYKKALDEELSMSDLHDIQQLFRAELAAVFFDLYKKRKTWSS